MNKKVIGAGVLLMPLAIQAQQQAAKPNIVVILLDDVGYSDFGCYGSEVPTPNIDKLAQNGIRMQHFYNMARSTPSRACLLTGLYPHQVGCGSLNPVPGHPNYQAFTNERNNFLPEVLKSVGYFNVVTGKWHIGAFKGVLPNKRGFDRSFISPAGGYYFPHVVNNKKDKVNEQNPGRFVFIKDDKTVRFDDPEAPKNWYSTQLWTDTGLNYIDEAIGKKQPFFWYLAYNGAHFPLQAPAETIKKYKGKYMAGFEKIRNARYAKQLKLGLFDKKDLLTPRNPKCPDWDTLSAEQKDKFDTQMAVYAAVMEELDKGIGKVLDHLKEKGVLDNTLILLMSDNGGNGEHDVWGTCEGKNPGAAGSNLLLGSAWADVANTPFFLYKHHGHEGGCNTPLIISYPNGINKKLNGTIDKKNYGHFVDIMTTLVDLTGATYPKTHNGNDVPPMEGVSLLPILKGGTVVHDKPTIVEHEGNKMLRDGEWKIVQENKETTWNLYNIKNDPTEMHDLAAQNPQLVKQLAAKYDEMAKHIGVEPEISFKVSKWYTPVNEYVK